MFKLGIYRKDQLTKTHVESFWGRRQFIAQDLYDQLEERSAEERAYLQEQILNRLSVNNGVFKFTASDRFDAFDQEVIREIAEHFPADQVLQLHDMGVSDGRTSIPLFEKLQKIYGERLQFLSSDYAPYLFSVRENGSKKRIIVNENNEIMQIVCPPFVFFTVHPESKILYPINFILRKLIERFYAVPLLKRYVQGDDPEIETHQVTLLCPDFQNLVKRHNNLYFEQRDIMEPLQKNYHVIRAMNLLNKAYFPDDFLRQAVESVKASLYDNGLFIVGSNKEQGTPVEGGIYQKQADKMICLYRSGQGAAVEPFILG